MINATPQPTPAARATPGLGEAVAVWLRIGLLSFGGPAGQIALMHRLLVEERGWVNEGRFLHALNFCMLLPGPEAQQLATYIGWMLHGVRGGLAAGVLFIVPGSVVILALSIIYALFQDLPLLAALFLGVKAAVLVVVIQALLRLGTKILKNRVMLGIAAFAFIGIFVFAVPFPLIVLLAGLIGWVGAKHDGASFSVLGGGDGSDIGEAPRPSALRSLRTLLLGLVLRAAPVLAAFVALGPDHVFVDLGAFFSKLATVTFGGAYAVLAYMAQEAVGVQGWLSAGEMMDGLGLAESTPGPLIMVVQFVGFLAALRNPAPFDPMLAAVIGSALTVWVTFVPCFLWIFLGAPYVERLRGNVGLSGALSAITAAIVGVIANLALWFGLQVLFRDTTLVSRAGMHILTPDLRSVDAAAVVLTGIAAVMLFRLRRGVVLTLGVCGLCALALAGLSG